jgi:transcriptional regulator with XRE-family HTH domain
MKNIYLNELKVQRELVNWSQEMLSEYSGVSVRTIQRIESGSRTSIESAKSLASALSLPSYDILLQPPPLIVSVDSNSEANVDKPNSEATFGEVANDILTQGRTGWFAFNIIASAMLLIFLPMYLNGIVPAFNIGALFLILSLAVFALAASRSTQYSLYHTTIFSVAFALIQWLNSSPTEGVWTAFYTHSQIERFRTVEDARNLLGGIQKAVEKFNEADQYRALTFADRDLSYSIPSGWIVHTGTNGELVVEVSVTKEVASLLSCEEPPSLDSDELVTCTVKF